MQRYLTTKDERAAARGIWTNGILCVPASLLFFGLGTALFSFYKTYPGDLSPTLNNGDAVLPWFITTQLPQGVAGLLIAAIFAASMSSLDSSMNSVSAAFTTDFYRRFKPNADDHTCLKLARWITVLVGTAGTLFALMMTRWDIKSLWDQLSIFIGLFTGGLGGLFLLGIFSRRAHGAGAVTGLVLSGAVQYAVKEYTSVHFLLYTFTGVVSCILIGYMASVIIPGRRTPVEGLTLHTLGKKVG
jgi:Na+/proline symporter